MATYACAEVKSAARTGVHSMKSSLGGLGAPEFPLTKASQPGPAESAMSVPL